MKQEIYAIRDIALGHYLQPMFLVNDGHVKRQFSDLVNNPEKGNAFHDHAEDFELMHIGTYDTETGAIEPTTPRQIDTGKAVLR